MSAPASPAGVHVPKLGWRFPTFGSPFRRGTARKEQPESESARGASVAAWTSLPNRSASARGASVEPVRQAFVDRGVEVPPASARRAATRAASSSASASSQRATTRQPPPVSPKPRRPPPASAKAKASLPSVTVTDHDIKENQNDSCTICLGQLAFGTAAIRIPCGHLFHQHCIFDWLKIGNACPVCRYELATDDAEYERHRVQRMSDRKLRLRMTDLQTKSVHEIIRLAEHLEIAISGCYDKSELIKRIAASPLVEITDAEEVDAARAAMSNQSTIAKLKASRNQLNQRLAELDRLKCVGTKRYEVEVKSGVGDLAGQIMAELKQTAARLDYELPVSERNIWPLLQNELSLNMPMQLT